MGNGLHIAANLFHDAIAQQNFHLHLLDQVIALFHLEEAFDLALVHLFLHIELLHLLQLLEDLVFLLQELTFLLIHLDLDVINLLDYLWPRGLKALFLNLSDHPLPLQIKLLQLAIDLVNLGLELLLRLFLPAGGDNDLHVDNPLQQQASVGYIHNIDLDNSDLNSRETKILHRPEQGRKNRVFQRSIQVFTCEFLETRFLKQAQDLKKPKTRLMYAGTPLL